MLIYIYNAKTYIYNAKTSTSGSLLLKMHKRGNEAYRIHARRKCFSNRKDVCLLKDNLKKIRSAVATLHESDMIFIAGYSACRFP